MKTTYTFHSSAVIPGIPRDAGGEGHAGLNVEVEDGVVVNSYLRDAPALDVLVEDNPTSPIEEPATDYTTEPLIEEPVTIPQEEQLPFPSEVVEPAFVQTEAVAAPPAEILQEGVQ